MAIEFVLGGLKLINGIVKLGTAYSESEAMKVAAEGYRIRGDFEKQAYDANAQFADMAAEDSVERGFRDASGIRRKAKQVRGSQRVALAAQGIDIETGTAAELQQDTVTLSQLDAARVKNNAQREAWGYRVQASDLRSRGKMAKLVALSNANALEGRAGATLLSGGLDFFNSALDAGATAYGGMGAKAAGGKAGGSFNAPGGSYSYGARPEREY